MKKILGLDLGTNSIGWALVKLDFDNKLGEILGAGSRIIPMSQDILGNFDAGNSISQTAERTGFRGVRRLRERHLLRRERLHRVLNILGFLPEYYAKEIDFEKHFGQFVKENEPKLAWVKNENDKYEFLFQSSFNEMVTDFEANGQSIKIPYDWTIYYLRKKALSHKITKEELAWLILNFNQKRGYYQLRGEEEEEENPNKLVEFHSLKIVDVVADEKPNSKGDIWYSLHLENGWIYRRSSKTPLFDWKDKVRDFIVTTDLNDDGTIKTDKEGNEKRSFRAPNEEDWTLLKKKTEADIEHSHKTVGTYIYDTLLQSPSQKIRGKLVRTIERKFYKTELEQILENQIKLQPELFTAEKFNDCVRELYKNNAEHQNELNGKNFVDLFIKDIIFYQRPLRSQKSNIGNCALEFREHKINELDENGKPIKNVFEKDENGKDIIVKEYLKGAPKSNPYYQEFRIWQWLYNLKIYTREDDRDVTKDFIKDTTDWENLFEFLMSKKEVGNKDVVEFLIEENNKKEVEQQIREQFSKLNDEKIRTKVNSELAKKVKELLPKYRWNYVFDNTKEKEEDKSKKYPCNETGYEIRRRLGKIENVPDTFLEMVDKKEVEITKKNEKTGKREKTGKTILVSLGSREYQLWHIIYSVTDKNEFEQALSNFAKKNNLDESPFVENFKNFKPFKSEYGSFSEKAIKKLLPLMRLGKYWNENEIPESVKERTKSIAERLEDIKDGQTIESVTDDDVQKQVLKSFSKFKNADLIDFMQGLQLYQASYLVYGRHSEAEIAGKWKSIADLEKYLEEFKQHSLRNPIVEQVITETLRVVRDIWKHYGQSAENFFDEIHIELGREMKNTAEDRAKITKQVSENENTNLRIKAMLMEFANDDSFKNQTDYSNYCKEGENLFFYKQGNNPVRPYSQTQHDILKIYEEYVLNDYTEQDLKNEKTGLTETKDGKSKELTIYDISQKSQPTKTQIEKYKLWLEQQYRSPYTGQMISLTKLFTPAYEIEHIIPKSRYFNDSFNNKVICEATVNKLKDTQLGLEFIRNNHGQIVDTGFGGTVKIFEEEAYQTFVKKHYAKNNAKRRNLLLDEIPDKMIDRQLNDTRYISKFISKLLSNIVRSETNDDGVNSTNLIPVTGKITSKLKQDWGLNDKWNELILPRFERMNQLTKSNDFTAKNKEGHTIPAIPLELSKGFKFKRIDHRHHAMDALIIACATREHVQYLNNENAKSQKFHLQRGLAKKLREFETVEIEKMEEKEKGVWVKSNKKEKREVPKAYFKPWDNFTVDSKNALEKIIVSFKQNLRVINKTVNKYQAYENGKKVTKTQTQGENWAIRKPLHKETVFAKVTLRKIKTVRLSEALKDWQSIVDKQLKQQIKTVIAEYGGSIDYEILNRYFKDRKYKFDGVDVSKVQVYYFDTENAATRKPLDTSFTERVIRESVTDTGIQKILLNHLQVKGNKPELAFSPEGIEEMNQNMLQLNDGKSHQPVYKVRVYEPVGNKFPVGFRGSKQSKYVEAAKGTNLFFAIYVDENGNRTFETIPLNIVIERLKQGLPEVPEHNDKGYLLLFHLSPNDLVYVPTKEEVENTHTKMIANLNRIYKIVSFTGNRLYAVPYYAAKSLVDKVEYTQLNKVESDIEDNLSIKHVCIKLKIDRLGGIL